MAYEAKFTAHKLAVTLDDGTFEGYGAVFGNVDSYGDVVVPGAFKATLREAKATGNWPAMLLHHGGGQMSAADMMPVGIWTDLTEDDVGLKVTGKLALDTSRGADTYALMKMQPRPALSGMSIGYRAKKFTLGTRPTEPRRKLEMVDLFEVSLVTFPANVKAQVESVKNGGTPNTIREFEDFLRDAGGFSHSAAKAIAASGYKAKSDPRDEDGDDTVAALRRAATLFHPS